MAQLDSGGIGSPRGGSGFHPAGAQNGQAVLSKGYSHPCLLTPTHKKPGIKPGFLWVAVREGFEPSQPKTLPRAAQWLKVCERPAAPDLQPDANPRRSPSVTIDPAPFAPHFCCLAPHLRPISTWLKSGFSGVPGSGSEKTE